MKLTNGPDHHSRAGLGAHPLFQSRVAEWVFGAVFWVLILVGRVVLWLIEHVKPLNHLVFRIMGELPHVPVGCQCAECQAKRAKEPK